MNVLDRIDRATFKAVDGTVLWLWNEWGVSYVRLLTIVTFCAAAASLGTASKWSGNYDAGFWIQALLVPPMLALSVWIVSKLGGNLWTAINLRTRSQFVSRAFRAFWVSFAASLFLAAHWLDGAAGVVWLVLWLIQDAAVPTKPRNKKRREVSAPNLSWSPT